MGCLRTKYHAGAVYLGEGMPHKSKALTADLVAVVRQGGDVAYNRFAGFVGLDSLTDNHCRVKLAHIRAYTEEPFFKPWVEYCRYTYALGVTDATGAVWCVLAQRYPVVWCDYPKKHEAS